MTDVQMFGCMYIMTNSDRTIDVDMVNGEWTKFARLELGGVMVNDKTLVSRLIVMMVTLAVGVT
jgi:hypothetical protein